MKKPFLFLMLLALYLCGYSQWKSSDIPDSLKVNADAVVRSVKTEYRVISEEKLEISESVVVTILREEGKKRANYIVYYDKDSRIEFIKGNIYDGNGKVIKKIKKADFVDQSMVSDYSIYEDNRVLFYEVLPLSYPFSIEYECRKVVNTSMFIPPWYPQIGYRVGLQNASLEIHYPKSNPLRYKAFNISPVLSSVDDQGNCVFTWKAANLKALKNEPYSTSFKEPFTSVIAGATSFKLGQYTGVLDSWKSYGRWLEKLQEGRSDLSFECQSKIKDLVKDEPDIRRKVSIVYKYMQSNTRYVSIQLGVGGWQPFPASSVEKNGYGDCKALVNYTRALLDAAGIKSYYCPIGVNESKIIYNDFPGANQTNHIILCVPNNNDTIWLECTSQHYPFNYISHEFQNQKAVLVDGENSRLVNLPKAEFDKNIQTRNIIVKVDSLGNAVGEMKTSVFGAELENLIPEIWSTKKDQMDIIQRKYRIPGIAFKDFNYEVIDDINPRAKENLNFSITGLASITGRRYFMPIGLFNITQAVPSKIKNRSSDMETDECYTHVDTLTYMLPKGFAVEYLPKAKTINSLFGNFYLSIKSETDRLIVVRKYEQKRGEYPAKEYNNYVDFLVDISKADKQSVILIKTREV